MSQGITTSPPNILLIVMDTARADVVYSLLESRELQGIKKFAQSGKIFHNAFANGPWTPPSHASIFSGQRTSIHGTHGGDPIFEPTTPTLAELLSNSGYETRGISGNSWISEEFGFDKGFDYLSMKWDRFWGGADLSSIAKSDNGKRAKQFLKILLNRNAPITIANTIYEKIISDRSDFGASRTTTRTIEWLESRSRDCPFFYFINYLEPHLPYEPPKKYRDKYAFKENTKEVNQDPWEYVAGTLEMSDEDFSVLKSLYRAEISYLDHHLNRLYDALDKTGYLDSTAVIIVGDHGENIGDHGLMDHQYSLHDTLLHVPLIFSYPDEIDSGEENGLVELRDLYPTIASIADVDTPTGKNISTNVITQGTTRESVFAEYRYPQPDMDSLEESVSELEEDYETLNQTLRSVRTTNWKLIQTENGRNYLFNTKKSLGDCSESHPKIVKRLTRKMDEENILLSRSNKSQTNMSPTTEKRLEDLGYI